jgi:hypothetical protein
MISVELPCQGLGPKPRRGVGDLVNEDGLGFANSGCEAGRTSRRLAILGRHRQPP